MAVVIQSSHEQPIQEIAQGMLLDTQFQHFIPEVAEKASPAAGEVQLSSPPQDVHLEQVDLSYPKHG